MPSSNRQRTPWITGRRILWTLVWLATLGAAFLAGAFAYRSRDAIRARFGGRAAATVVQTNLHNVRVRQVAIPAEGRDGGIAPLGDDVLLAARTGRMWLVDNTGELRELAVRVPLNQAEFDADPFNEQTINRELFGVKDVLVDERPDGSLRLFASHNHWHADRDCYVVRVSSLETTAAALLTMSQEEAEWAVRFDSSPCRPLSERSGGNRSPSLGAGGRMVLLDENRLLVTMGGLGPESDPEGARMAQQADNTYGKTMLIDLATNESRIYTMGHRNPQGLALGADGRVWLTEHGARGGDELNLLEDGANYGYPEVSYGTAYEAMTWPSNPVQGRHEGYAKPVFGWTPGVGVSQAWVLAGNGFPHWRTDVLVASLKGNTLFRIRIEDGRVIFAEPIPIGHRLRDITEAADGSIVLKTDDDLLIYLTSLEAADASTLTPLERGAGLASHCQGCHTFTPQGGNSIGPRLWSVVGREVASVPNYPYSAALRELGGRWTPERLSAFLAAPDSVAPGTTMQASRRYEPAEIESLVAYLETLR